MVRAGVGAGAAGAGEDGTAIDAEKGSAVFRVDGAGETAEV